MDSRTWLDDPKTITDINAVPILPTTIKGLKIIVADYRKKGMRPVWRTTHFQYLTVVARLLEVGSKYVLSDNTDILIHEVNKPPTGVQLLLRHHYYRFIFDITPYSEDSLAILSIRSLSTAEVSAHMAEVVQEELKAKLHEKLLETQIHNTHQKQVETVWEIKKTVQALISDRKEFKAEELERQVKCGPEILGQILQQLSNEAKIGDMGSYYRVFLKQ